MPPIEISTDRSRLDVALIHRFLSDDSYWVKGISRANVERSIENSLCFGAYIGGAQVAFARVVSDYVRFAHLQDVFVLPQFRGQGISKRLMAYILALPELSAVTKFTLGTLDAHGLYAQFGFASPQNPERLMELQRSVAAPASANRTR